jgi:hypothetical protein
MFETCAVEQLDLMLLKLVEGLQFHEKMLLPHSGKIRKTLRYHNCLWEEDR